MRTALFLILLSESATSLPPALVPSETQPILAGGAKEQEEQARLDATLAGVALARAEREAAQREPETEAGAAGRKKRTAHAGEANAAEAQARLDAAVAGAKEARAESEATQHEPGAGAAVAGTKTPTLAGGAKAAEAGRESSARTAAGGEAASLSGL